jgi:SAM-dependent methyltransferase
MHALEAGRRDDALLELLGVDDVERRGLVLAIARGANGTYREAVGLLCDDAEGTWCLHRFSDPTFVTAEALISAVGVARWPFTGRVLDLCGGTGHLTRVLEAQQTLGDQRPTGTVLADVYFWKLWLADRFIVPGVDAVCCDANNPLPFARDTFSTAFLADAFPYIWHKRLLAEEMMRLVGDDGLVVMPHLHSALGDNFSAGDTLTPAAYSDLFALRHPRLFSDATLFDDVIEQSVIDLSRSVTPAQLGEEASMTLIASARTDLFRRFDVPANERVSGGLSVNPLYKIERKGRSSMLELRFPTPEYEAEFGACRRYMPERVTLEFDTTSPIRVESVGPDHARLRKQRVLIDVPARF